MNIEMLRLLTFFTLLAAVIAQNGYEYNKPDKPFGQGQGTTVNQPGYNQNSPGGYPGTAPSFSGSSQGQDYTNTNTGSQGFSGPANYPTGPSQGYQANGGQTTQAAFGGQGLPQGQQGFQSQSQAPSGFPALKGPNYQGQGQNYPVQTGPSSGSTGPTGTSGYGPGAVSSFGSSAGSGFGSDDTGAYEGGDYSAIPGEPDRDYPIFTEIPQTSFRCDAQAYPGYYADVEGRCQVFHVCSNNRTFDFLCPNGTIFSQQVFVCVWWNQFDCNSALSFYELNANLYDYSKTGSSSQAGYSTGQGQSGPSPALGAYPGTSRQQGVSGSFPGTLGPQGSNDANLGGPGPLGPPNGYPSSSGLQGYSGSPGTQDFAPGVSDPANFQGGTGPQGPTNNYAAPGQSQVSYSSNSASTSYPGSSRSVASYSSSQATAGYSSSPGQEYQTSSQGYPSGKPSGPAFSSGRPQPDVGFPLKQPNREYLPPRN